MSRAMALGREAEERAARHIASLGWEILGRNVTNRCGELDLVAKDRSAGELVVVEVRCRTLGKVQSPLESVGPAKLRTLVRAARTFVEEMGWDGFWRIDLVGITADRGGWRLEHLKDITGGMEGLE